MKFNPRNYATLLALLVSLNAHGADAPLVVCVDAGNPPFMSLIDNKPAGLYPAIIAAALKAAGVNAKVDAKPWKRCIADLDDGKVSVGGIYKNEQRLAKYDFSDPIFTESMAVYFLRVHPIELVGVEGLYGKRVGVVRGWSYGDAFDNAVKEGKILAEEVTTDAQNFQKLSAGRIDAVLAIEEAGAALLKTRGTRAIQKSPHYLFENPTYLATHKEQQQTDTLDKFNKAIADMKKSGQLQKIATSELSK